MTDVAEDTSDPILVFLSSLAGQHVHFFPKSGNAGDGLITHATYELFERFNISYTAYHQSETALDGPVLIGGGGNLVEGRYTDVAELIQRHSPLKIVLLPHTVVGYADILARTHDNLTLFLRDPVSHALALANGAKEANTFLSHDLAFFLEPDHFAGFQGGGKGVLHALRQDGESTGALPIGPDNLDLSLSWNGDIWTDRKFCRASTESLASYIAQFDSVLTDRLHISILASMLGKRVTLLPNAYFKNRAIYEHSMCARFAGTQFVNVLPRAPGAFDGAFDASERLSSSLALEREVTRRERAERALQLLRDEMEEGMDAAAQARVQEKMDAVAQLEARITDLLDEKRLTQEALNRRVEASTELEERVVALLRTNSDQTTTEKFSKAIDMLEDQIARLSQQSSNAEVKLAELYRSRSWRVTAPLRKIMTMLRRG